MGRKNAQNFDRGHVYYQIKYQVCFLHKQTREMLKKVGLKFASLRLIHTGEGAREKTCCQNYCTLK